MSTDAARTTVARYFEYVNTDRFDDLRSLFADDVVLEMAGASRRDGVDAALGFYPLALAPMPQHLDDPVSVLVDADGARAVAEIAFSGTTTDGRPVEFTAVDLFDLDADGRIRRLRSFYDTARVARLLQPPSR